MELLQLKYFKAVAECGKIKTAAEQLFVSSPALSASISRLESDLGVKLFDRSNNRIVLNEQGRIFLHYVDLVFTNLESARKDIQLSLEERNVNIPLAVTTSNLWLELFDAYALAKPDVTLSVSTYHLHRMATIDLQNSYSFLMADLDNIHRPEWESALLFVDSLYVMLPREHRLASQQDVSLAELAGEVIFLTIPGQTMNSRVRSLFIKEGVPLKCASEYSTEACRHMVAKGRGISFTTQHTLRTDPNICYLPLRTKVQWEQRLYWHQDRVLTKEEQEFKEFILNFFQGATDLPAFLYSYYLDNE